MTTPSTYEAGRAPEPFSAADPLVGVPDLLLRAAREHGQTLAVRDTRGCLSYAQLDALADDIAESLRAAGVGATDPVALFLPKCAVAIAAMHAAWRLGSPYMPVSPSTPAARQERLWEQTSVRAVVIPNGEDALRAAHTLPRGVPTVVAPRGCSARRAPLHRYQLRAEDAAVLLHTSGSTGQPKTAVLTQRNLAVFAAWARSEFALTRHDVLLSHAPLEFDLSFFDLFAATAAGATVVLLSAEEVSQPQRIAEIVNACGVTVWQSVPSALTLQLSAFARYRVAMPSVRCVLFAGERMPRTTLLGLPQLFPNARFFNVYGCTETNDSFMYRVPADVAEAPDPLPIGSALPYIGHRIVDEQGMEVRAGHAGQLLVAGDTVMRGYLARAAQETLMASPALRLSPGFYPTRDLVSWGSDGALRFHGRVDSVVKIHGHQVNLTEVADQLRRHPSLEEAAALALEDARGTRLVAVVRLREGHACSPWALRMHCARSLPKQAIPQEYRVRAEPFPLGGTQKVDLHALRAWWTACETSDSQSSMTS